MYKGEVKKDFIYNNSLLRQLLQLMHISNIYLQMTYSTANLIIAYTLQLAG